MKKKKLGACPLGRWIWSDILKQFIKRSDDMDEKEHINQKTPTPRNTDVCAGMFTEQIPPAWHSSKSFAKLAEALAKAQGEMAPLVKDSTNPFFDSSYASLAACYAACGEALAKNGIAVIQGAVARDNMVEVTSILAHSSGEWIQFSLGLTPQKKDPQGIGSAITYGRRYLLTAMVGLAPSDDDGEGATGRETDTKTEPMRRAQTPRNPNPGSPKKNGDEMTTGQVKYLGLLRDRIPVTKEQFRSLSRGLFGKESSVELTKAEASKLIGLLTEGEGKEAVPISIRMLDKVLADHAQEREPGEDG
jgi:hypothetical protein